jgi:large repetitive protein
VATTGPASPPVGVLDVRPDGSLSYTPVLDWQGNMTFAATVTTTGPGPQQTANTTVTVTLAVSDPPPAGLAAADDAFACPFGLQACSVAAPGVLANDAGGANVTVTSWTQPAAGSVAVQPNGSFVFLPSAP